MPSTDKNRKNRTATAFGLFAATFFISAWALAETNISCWQENYEISIKLDELKSNPPQSPYTLKKSGLVIRQGTLVKMKEGLDSLNKRWGWALKGDDAAIGIELVNAPYPQRGNHAAISDLILSYDGGKWMGIAADCLVEIK